MENINTIDLYSVILDYNQLFFETVTFRNAKEKYNSAVLLMGLFNYIMAYNDCDLQMDTPNEVVRLDRRDSQYSKVFDDTSIVKMIADYIAVYIPQIEEDLGVYHITNKEGIRVYTTYLNVLVEMYGLEERYSKKKMDTLYQELMELKDINVKTIEHRHYH